MSMLNSITRGFVASPPRVILYGREGVGKSTFAAMAPAPIFIPTEDGLNQINCARFPVAENFDDVKRALATLKNEHHEFQTVVIDSLDWLQKIIWEGFKRRRGVLVAKVEYGGGYAEVAAGEWKEFLDGINFLHRQKNMAVILVAHEEIIAFNNPDTSSYSRYAPKLHKSINGTMIEWADAVLFATQKVNIEKEKQGFGKERSIATVIRGAYDDGRILICNPGPTVTAKNRYNIPDEIPLSWATFQQYIVPPAAPAPAPAAPAAQ